MHTRSMGLAKDILYEAERGGYHALLLGRRGLTGTEGLFLGGVTNKVVQHAERVPVWVVGEQINSHRILCAVECSGGAMRVVQYLSSMLGGGEHCTVTLFHVGDKLNGTSRDENQGQWQGSDLESFYPDDLESVWEEEAFDVLSQERQRSLADFGQQARGLLEESGLRPDQIQVMYVADRYGVAEGILKELDTGKYGTVVLGGGERVNPIGWDIPVIWCSTVAGEPRSGWWADRVRRNDRQNPQESRLVLGVG